MPDIHTLKSVFNGGELSPMLGSRVDSEKYASGCKELTNFIPTVYGGIKKRPGTELLGFTKDDGPARLHGFRRSTDTNYMLEFGAGYVRFWKGGAVPARVVVNGNNELTSWVGSGNFRQWYSGSHTAGSYVMNQGHKYVCSTTHFGQEGVTEPGYGSSHWLYWSNVTSPLGWFSSSSYAKYSAVWYDGRIYLCTSGPTLPGYPPLNHSSWQDITDHQFNWGNGTVYRLNDQVVHEGLIYRALQTHTALYTLNRPQDGDEWTGYWQQVTGYKAGDWVKNGSLFYACKETHFPSPQFATDSAKWREIPQDAGTGLFSYALETPYTATEVFDLQFTQLNDVLFIAHENHPPKRLSHHAEKDWVLEDVPFQYAPSLDVNEDRASVQVQFDEVPPFGQPWVSTTVYARGDRVHGIGTTSNPLGYVYECTNGHTAAAATQPGVGADWYGRWKLVWKAEIWWNVLSYEVGDEVYHLPPSDGKLYTCRAAHAASDVRKPGSGSSWTNYWNLKPQSDVGYRVGDRVTAVDIGTAANKYNGDLFTCCLPYNPGSATNDEPGHGTAWQSYWNQGTSSVKVSAWVNNYPYKVQARVRVGKTVYECTKAHSSSLPGAAPGGRPGTTVLHGNKPGVSRGWTRCWRIVGADTDLADISFVMYATDPLFTEEDVGTTWLLEIGTGGIVEDMVIPTANNGTGTTENNPLFIQGGFTVTTVWNAKDAMVGTLTIEESLNGVTWSVVRQFTQYSKEEGNILYNGEAPATGAWYRMSLVTAGTSTATSRIKMEAVSSVYRLPFRVTEFGDTKKVKGNLLMPGNQMPPAIAIGVSTSIFRKPAFSKIQGFPRTVAFHDSRLWWGGTRLQPTRMWASQSEDYYIYLGGSLDTDGLDLTLATVEANAIQWMTGFNRSLVVGTSGDEWTVDSGDTDEALTPTNIRARRRTRYGSNGLPPQLTGDALLWIRRGGGRLHEFAYVYERDSFSAPDLTLLAEHMLHLGKVRQTVFVSCPDPVLWMVNENYLLGLSYSREHNVTAWHKHEARNASFISLASTYGSGAADEVWFVVKRGGMHSVERFHPGTLAWYHGGRLASFDPQAASFIDGSRSATGSYNATTGKTTFTGFKDLYRLHAAFSTELAGLLDGQSVSGTGVFTLNAAGVVTVNGNCARLTLGCSFVRATMQSMNLEVLLDGGTSQGRKWRLIRVIPSVWRSRTFSLASGLSADSTVTLADDTTRILEEIHFSGSFEKQLTWGVKSHNAHPCNLLGAVLKFEVTGG